MPQQPALQEPSTAEEGYTSLTRYLLYEPSSPNNAPRQRWELVLAVIMIGFGAHATNHALTPVQPDLEALGMSPILYALITLLPQLGHLLLPTIWAIAYNRQQHVVLILAPGLLCVGTACIAVGLSMNRNCSEDGWGCFCGVLVMGAGFLMYTASRAGISVLQHCLLAACLPDALVAGLCILVASTHANAALVSFFAPRIMKAYGLEGLELALLPPALIGLAAGVFLSRWMPVAEDPDMQGSPRELVTNCKPFVIYCKSCGSVIARHSPFIQKCRSCMLESATRWHVRVRILLLGMWRAIVLGTLHSFASVTNGLLVTHHLTSVSAGSLVAFMGILSLAVLPVLPFIAKRYVVSKLLMIVTCWLLLFTAMLLILTHLWGDTASWSSVSPVANKSIPIPGNMTRLTSSHGSEKEDGSYEPADYAYDSGVDQSSSNSGSSVSFASAQWLLPRIALVGLTTCGAAAPVILLALVPSTGASQSAVTRAFGHLESFFVLGQSVVTLVMGVTRQYYGYRGTLWMLCGQLLAGVVFARAILVHDSNAPHLNVNESPAVLRRMNSTHRPGKPSRHGWQEVSRTAERVYGSFMALASPGREASR